MASNVSQLPFWLQLPFLLFLPPLLENTSGVVTMGMILSVVLIGSTCLSTSRHCKDGSGCRHNRPNEDVRTSAHDNHDRRKAKKFVQFRCRRQDDTEHAKLKAMEDFTRIWNSKPHGFQHAIHVMARLIECKHISSFEFSGSPLVSEIQCTLQKHDHDTKMVKTTRISASLMFKRVGEFFDVVSHHIVLSPWTREQPSGGSGC